MTTPVEQLTLREKLGLQLEKGEREARRRGVPILISTTVAIPHLDAIGLFETARTEERILWEQPSEALSMLAVGVAEQITGRGKGRFSQIATSWRRLVSRTLTETSSYYPFADPICMGGFAFDPARKSAPSWQGYPDALLVVPQFLFVSLNGSSWLTVNLMATAGCDILAASDAADRQLYSLLMEDGGGNGARPVEALVTEDAREASDWKAAVEALQGEIGKGTMEKVVLARKVEARAKNEFDLGLALRRLRSGYGNCTIFAFARGKSCFVGATPERLVRLDGKVLKATCLAGSTARGVSDEEDQALGQALLADRKERHEHALVVRALRDTIRPVCSQLSIPNTPSLLRMPNIQHLHTPVEGVIAGEGNILEFVERLHPTPAAAGLPREAALSLIHAYEPFERGWYAGPVGWIDGCGRGEFVVAIRSALLRGNKASLYAGCGIVADSDPEREHEESCLKLRSMLWALNSK